MTVNRGLDPHIAEKIDSLICTISSGKDVMEKIRGIMIREMGCQGGYIITDKGPDRAFLPVGGSSGDVTVPMQGTPEGEVFSGRSDGLFNSAVEKRGFLPSARNLLCVPVVSRSRKLGLAGVYGRDPSEGGFTVDDIRILTAISYKIAVVMEYEDLLSRMNERIEGLNSLIKASILIGSTLKLDMLLDIIMNLGLEVFNAEGSSLLLIDEKTNRLNFVAVSGAKKEIVRNMSLALGEGIAGWVAEQGEPVLISDASHDDRFSKRVDKSTGMSTRTIMCVPLKARDRIIGVVEVINRLDRSGFTQEHLGLLMSFASQAAVAIDKARLFNDLDELFISTIRTIADAIEAKDRYTRGHCERIRRFSLMIARQLGMDEGSVKDVELAALLHDVGKIGVPESVLLKKEKLTDEDWAQIRKHPDIGADLLSSIKQLKQIVPGVRCHQERFDGKGYPAGLKGEDIPLLARIIAVADTFDAMTTDRPYRKAMSEEQALEEIEKCAGTQFDSRCACAFVKAYRGGPG